MLHKTGDKSLGNWLWDAASKIRGAHDGPKYMDSVLPLVFAKRAKPGKDRDKVMIFNFKGQ